MPSPFKQKWLNEALETLARYNVNPVIDKFLKNFNMAVRGLESDKLLAIGKRIANPRQPPSFEDLADYIDELKMYGKQHVFLYELKGDYENYLNKLRDPHYIEKQLRQFEEGSFKKEQLSQFEEGSFKKSKLVWQAPKPELAEVRHFLKDGEGLLLFKWVETRGYEEETVDGDGIRRYPHKDERSANFFIVNLRDGTAEIRIQSIQTLADKKAREELDIYKKEINRLIKFSNFSPVPLEPIVKGFLGKHILPITVWELIYPKRRLAGAGDPSYFFKLGLPFKNFFGREITIYWKCKQKVTGKPDLFFTLNGESNQIKFNAITDKSKVDFILDELRKLSKESIELEELKQLAIRYPEYSRVISSIDYHFSKLRKLNIRADKLSSEIWYSGDFIKDVFKVAEENFPKTFHTEEKKKEGSILVFDIHFKVKDGVWHYWSRKAEKSRRRKILKPAVAAPFVFSFGWLVIEAIRSYITEMALEESWNAVVPSIPFKIVQGLVLCIVALVYFGSRPFGFLGKIPQQFLSATLTLFFGSEVQKTREFSEKYKKWDKEKVNIGVYQSFPIEG